MHAAHHEQHLALQPIRQRSHQQRIARACQPRGTTILPTPCAMCSHGWFGVLRSARACNAWKGRYNRRRQSGGRLLCRLFAGALHWACAVRVCGAEGGCGRLARSFARGHHNLNQQVNGPHAPQSAASLAQSHAWTRVVGVVQ